MLRLPGKSLLVEGRKLKAIKARLAGGCHGPDQSLCRSQIHCFVASCLLSGYHSGVMNVFSTYGWSLTVDYLVIRLSLVTQLLEPSHSFW